MPKDFSPLSMKTPAVSFRTVLNSLSFLTSLDQLQISFKYRKTDRIFYPVKQFVFGKSRFWTESCLSLIVEKFVDMFVMVLGQINSVSFVFETLRNKESKFSFRRCRVRTCLR